MQKQYPLWIITRFKTVFEQNSDDATCLHRRIESTYSKQSVSTSVWHLFFLQLFPSLSFIMIVLLSFFKSHSSFQLFQQCHNFASQIRSNLMYNNSFKPSSRLTSSESQRKILQDIIFVSLQLQAIILPQPGLFQMSRQIDFCLVNRP